MPALIDLTGKQFGRWRVLERASVKKGTSVCWICLCDCGKRRVVASANLIRGDSRSCGCFNRDKIRAACLVHGNSPKKGQTPVYNSWCKMIGRCENPRNRAFPNYGGRGITISPKIRSFQNFYSLMGDRPAGMEIERICNDGDYAPGNIRWATHKEQQRNKRNNHLLTYNGKTQCVTAWAEELGLKRATIEKRIHHGWPVERLLSPVKPQKVLKVSPSPDDKNGRRERK